ncbi:hypothetical protein A2U01_0076711, partial [Trifolium medium]|nr:hypothetical protein [Trifolium medium]
RWLPFVDLFGQFGAAGMRLRPEERYGDCFGRGYSPFEI